MRLFLSGEWGQISERTRLKTSLRTHLEFGFGVLFQRLWRLHDDWGYKSLREKERERERLKKKLFLVKEKKIQAVIESFLKERGLDDILVSPEWAQLWGGTSRSDEGATEGRDIDIPFKIASPELLKTWEHLVRTLLSQDEETRQTRLKLGLGPPFDVRNVQSSLMPTESRVSELCDDCEYDVYFGNNGKASSWTLLAQTPEGIRDVRANDTQESLMWIQKQSENYEANLSKTAFSAIMETPKGILGRALSSFLCSLDLCLVSFESLSLLGDEWAADKLTWKKDLRTCFSASAVLDVDIDEFFNEGSDIYSPEREFPNESSRAFVGAWAVVGIHKNKPRIVAALWAKEWSQCVEGSFVELSASKTAQKDPVEASPHHLKHRDRVDGAVRASSLFIRAAGLLPQTPHTILQALALWAIAETASRELDGVVVRMPKSQTRAVLIEGLGLGVQDENAPARDAAWSLKLKSPLSTKARDVIQAPKDTLRGVQFGVRIFPTPPQMLGLVIMLRLPLIRETASSIKGGACNDDDVNNDEDDVSMISSSLMSTFEKA